MTGFCGRNAADPSAAHGGPDPIFLRKNLKKGNSLMKKNLKKFAIVGLAAAMAVSAVSPLGTVTAQAKKTRKVTTRATKPENAPAVRAGKTRVYIRKSNSYIKFTAKTSKTYRFTFSSITPPTRKNVSICGHTSFWIDRSDYSDVPNLIEVKTKGGKTEFLELSNRKFLRHYNQSKIEKVNRYYTSRTGSLYLNEGETVYICSFFAGVKNGRVLYNLTIK